MVSKSEKESMTALRKVRAAVARCIVLTAEIVEDGRWAPVEIIEMPLMVNMLWR